MALNVVMLGPPGAGKGTQAERFARSQGVPKISTGDILREAARTDTPLGRTARETMEAGRLVGDEVMVPIVRERIGRDDARAGFVLDGFPRTVPQAEALDRMVADRGPIVVLQLAVPTDELVRRLSGRRICGSCGRNAPPNTPATAACATCGGALVQRPDDAEEVVRERLRVFERDTRPLVEFYQPRPTFYVVDGNRPPDEVAEALVATVERFHAAVRR